MANLILWSSYSIFHAATRPEACYQLASWIRQHGYSVKVIEFCHFMSAEDLVSITEKHIEHDTLAIGVSSSFWEDYFNIQQEPTEPNWVVNARRILDSRFPKMRWLLGGSASVSANLNFSWIKFPGYAEDDLLKWMDNQTMKLKFRKLFDINASQKFFSSDDFIQPYEVIPIELGRGCQFKCKFCSYPLIGKKKGTYIRDFGLIREELIRNYNEYGTTRYYFVDETVNESVEKIQALADIAQGLPFEIGWTGYNRLDLIGVRPDMIQLLKDSGLKSAYFGIESFHPKASMIIGKGWNGKHGKDFLLRLKEEWKGDITWRLSFIGGLPEETPEDLEETQQWCIDNEMYDWTFMALSINYTKGKIWKSEFDLEYKKHGYDFPDANKHSHWKNNIWNREKANDLCVRLNNESASYKRPTTWILSELASLGYTYPELMNLRSGELRWDVYRQQAKDMANRYVVNQLQ